MSDQEMLKYLIEKCGIDDVRKEIRCAGARISEFFLSDKYPLPKNPLTKMRSMYKNQKEMDDFYSKKTKSYDDQELEDLKAGTSRHGSNRGSSSFATSNNGMSY